MLVFISDLHLSDGTTDDVVNSGAFEMFVERVQDLAFRASWRADGSYSPIEQLDLVLLGDVFDILRSRRWLDGNVRPWTDLQSPGTVETISAIVDGILQTNHLATESIRSLSQGRAVQLPPQTQSGEPVYGAELIPVAVRTFYMVGNHDWMLHVRGARYDAVRQKIVQRLGLAHPATQPFPHDPYESDELLSVLRRHRTMARHGDVFDPFNFSETRDISALGDVIVIELVNRFVTEILLRYGQALPRSVTLGLREMIHVRPLILVPVWVEGLLDRSGTHPELKRDIKRCWDKLIDEFLHLQIVREQDTWRPFQLVDRLEQVLKFSKRVSLGWTAKMTAWLNEMRGASTESYYEHALNEPDFRNRRARHIVYGHTHAAESVPLDASHADGYVLNQLYFNTGTWRRVYRQTQWAPAEQEFIPAESMSYVAFYQGDERSGRPFETWTGSLAAVAGDIPVHRLDGGRATHASEQPISASAIPVRAPHFRRSVPSARSTTPYRQ